MVQKKYFGCWAVSCEKWCSLIHIPAWRFRLHLPYYINPNVKTFIGFIISSFFRLLYLLYYNIYFCYSVIQNDQSGYEYAEFNLKLHLTSFVFYVSSCGDKNLLIAAVKMFNMLT